MNRKLAPGFTLVELLVVMVIIAALAGLAAPMVLRQKKKADQTEAINNARQIGLGLIEFESDYGSFPDAATAATVAANTGVAARGVANSNDYFKQLFDTGIGSQETVFYCKAPVTTAKPDNVTGGARLLEGGEVGFGYILDGPNGLKTSGNTARPVVVAPLAAGAVAANPEFDKDYYDAKAVLLRIDGSVVTATIPAAGANANRAVISGANALVAGADTVWGATAVPTVSAPLPKP